MLTFIKTSTALRSLLVLLALALVVPLVSHAQTPEEAAESFVDSGDTLAFTSITDASLIGQDEENLVISFSLINNGTRPQFDIRYGIELIRKEGPPGEETQVIVDTFVAREEVVVSAGESVAKVVGYPFAGIPPGTYEIWVIAQTSGGATLGISKAADFTVSSAEVVEIVAESCALTVAGEAGTSYDLYQGVDVSVDEDIVLTCTLKNHGASNVTVLPNFMTYERNVYGEQVTVPVPTEAAITLAAGAEVEVSLTLPKATTPQAYDAVLSLVDETTRAVKSNNLIAHYVIQGASATIQTVDFDKNAYRAGDVIGLVLSWTPAADTFEDSRSGDGTDIGAVTAVTRVVDGNGAVCSEETSMPLTEPTVTIRSSSLIDCVQPAASVRLVSADGTTLDSEEIAVEVVEDLGVATGAAMGDRNSALMFATIVAFALALLAVLIAMNRRKKIDFINASKVLLIFAIASAGFFGANVEKVEAVFWTHTYYSSGAWRGVNVTVNPNRYSFSPGETIQLNSMIVSSTCSNGRTPQHHLTATLQSQVATVSQRFSNTSTYYSTGYLTAPTAAGIYNINLRMYVNGFVTNRTIQISVNVPPPPPPPPPAATGNVSGNNCTIAVGASTCNTTISWRSANAASPNLRNVTRPYTYDYIIPNSYRSATYQLYGSATGNNVVVVRNNSAEISTRITLRATCAGGSDWNGSVCAATAPPVPPSADVSATPCVIPIGASTCQGTATWVISNPVNPRVENSSTNVPFSNSSNGTNEPVNMTFGVNTVTAFDGSLPPLRSVNVSVPCATGSDWNPVTSICDAVPPPPPEPLISLSLSRELIRSGETVDVTVDVEAEYPAECTVYGVESTPIVFTHNGTPADPISSDVFTSRPLKAAQVVTVTCEPNPANGAASNTATSRVDVIPVVEEI